MYENQQNIGAESLKRVRLNPIPAKRLYRLRAMPTVHCFSPHGFSGPVLHPVVNVNDP